MGVGKMRMFLLVGGRSTSDDGRGVCEQRDHDRPANGGFPGEFAPIRSSEMAISRLFKAFARGRTIGFSALMLFVIAVSCAVISTAKADIVQEKINGVNAIFITNDIVAGDNDKFRKIANGITGRTAVFLKSNGGALYEALAIGESIRSHRYPTVVSSGDTCASSCALIWLGGANRYISASARVGFHAAYTSDGKDKKETSVGNAVVGAYLTKMNLSINAVVFATSAPPDQVRWLHPDDAKSVGITCIALKDSPKPIPVAPVEHVDASPDSLASIETSFAGDMSPELGRYQR
jgi:hypothetical protein